MMSVLNQFETNSDPHLSNAFNNAQNVGTTPSFLNPLPSVPSASVSNSYTAPPVPPRQNISVQTSYGLGNLAYPYGGMPGSYGMGFGSYGSPYGMNGMGSAYNGFNRFNPTYGPSIESRFIQIAEDSSRPAFDSIQSVVNAVGSIAMMLDNTFFALTSSFRAILGVAENFGRLRSLFAQFWSTFAIVRSINWLIRKILVLLGIRTQGEFKAWAEAVAATQNGTANPAQRQRGSGWLVVLFFGIIASAPYIVLKMLGGISNTINEQLNNPSTWKEPLRAVAQYDFNATSPQEISFKANQIIQLAPQQLQGSHWNSGWLMGTVDRQTAGFVPVNYIKVIRPNNQEKNNTEVHKISEPNVNGLEKYYPDEL